MVDVFTPEKRSSIMRAICSKNTLPELKIRKILHAKGYRYRIHDKKLPGKPDIVFRSRKIAIQIRGCFWHGHNCIDGHIPKTRRDYWIMKITNNARRDAKNDLLLKKQGWKVITIWECSSATKSGLAKQIGRIEQIYKRLSKTDDKHENLKSISQTKRR